MRLAAVQRDTRRAAVSLTAIAIVASLSFGARARQASVSTSSAAASTAATKVTTITELDRPSGDAGGPEALPAGPHPLESLRILSLAAYEQRAVVRSTDDRQADLVVVKVGDLLPGSEAVVLQILPDRIVAEEPTPGAEGQRRWLWIFRSGRSGQAPRIVTLERHLSVLVRVEKPYVVRIPANDVAKDETEDERGVSSADGEVKPDEESP